MNKSLLTNICSCLLILVGLQSPIYGEVLLTMGLYSLSGGLTNWLAIHMLFEKVPFLYGSGVVSERFEEFKIGIKNLMMNQFFTQENFEKFLGDSKSALISIEEESLFESLDFDKVFEKLKQAILESSFGGMLGMFGGPAALDPLRPQFEDKFKEIISDILKNDAFLSKLMHKSEQNTHLIDRVSDLVEQRLNELTPQAIKEIIQEMIKEHLGWLVVWGGVFGALIGLLTTLL